MSNQVAKIDVKQTTAFLGALIDRNKDNLPTEIREGIELLKNNAMMYVAQNETVAKYAMEHPMEVAQHLYNFVTLGLDVYRKDAYLLMYGKKLTPIIDYKGQIALVLKYSAVDILKIEYDMVKKNDKVNKLNGVFTHEYNPFEPRGENVGVTCTVFYANGEHTTTIMTKDEVMKVKNASPSSKSSFSPWVNWEESMWIKTVIRNATKTIPLDFNKGNMETAKILQSSYDNADNEIEFDFVETPQESNTVEVKPNVIEAEVVENVKVVNGKTTSKPTEQQVSMDDPYQ